METLKQEIVVALSKLPDTASLNDIQATVNEVSQKVSTKSDTTVKPVSFLEAAKEYAGFITHLKRHAGEWIA